jgi:flagellar basal body-associated protein FliL
MTPEGKKWAIISAIIIVLTIITIVVWGVMTDWKFIKSDTPAASTGATATPTAATGTAAFMAYR